MNTLIAPSVLAADFANLQKDSEMLNKSQADWFHIDIMDGVFVPNISFGMPVLKAIANHRTLQKIKSCGMKAGVALNPHTPISVLDSIIKDIDIVCIMSVNPGFGGQSFIEETYTKVRALKALITEKGSTTLIEIDGGVTNKNAKQLVDAGADVLVAGSYVFGAENPMKTIEGLKSL
jgi:ribulose-phosphate 3-epimerase